MTKKNIIIGLLLLLFTGVLQFANAQNRKEKAVSFSGQIDLKSLHYWRGFKSGDAPSVEPSFSLSAGGFCATLWGGYTFDDKYREVDLILSYTHKNFTITLADYYNPAFGVSFPDKAFVFTANSTIHLMEGIVDYTICPKFPLQLKAACIFYGADKDVHGNNYHSTYFEALYPFNINDVNFNVWLGFSPFKGMYSEVSAFVNNGFSGMYSVKLGKKIQIPVEASVLWNPYLDKVYGRLAVSYSF
ncbi:MAG: hypothetical protein ACEPOW_02595 [Bacteroidales bacterium]